MKPSIVAKLEALHERHEEVQALLGDAQTIADQERFRALSREYAQLSDVSRCFTDWQQVQEDIETAQMMLDDPEMREMAQDELREAKEKSEQLEQQLQVLLLPKDPDDERNAFLEVRAGTGGDEAALFAGVMLAVAGCIIQRLTGNPMASPEVLGISSGAAFGVVLMLFLVPGNAFGWLLPAGSLGAAVTLLIIMIAAGRGGFSPHRMLLAGMALSTAFTMLLMMLQASGDPRMAQVLTWISGSTYNATDAQVWRTGIVMVILLAITPLCRRWLTILPLGGDTARAVGMALTPTRIALLLLAACLTATATMTIGPLSFVGLMAPHIARMMGFRRTMPHIVISALVGGLLLVFADWCGRMVLFPFQIPAGLLSTFIGAPYFIYLLRKQSR